MESVAALLGAASAAYALARWLEAPVLPFLLAAGVALSALAPVPPGLLEDGLLLGVSVLLFTAGLELDPGRLRARGGAAIRVGLVQAGALAALGFAACLPLGFTALEAGYLALALTASSTLVGVRILKRRRELYEPYGQLVLGVLLLQDVLVLLAIPLVRGLGATGDPLPALGALALLGAACLAVRRWGAPLLDRADDELLVLASLSVLFLFVWGADRLGLPLVVGAFLAGVSLARFPVNQLVRSETAPIGEFFSALFFTALGALVRFPPSAEVLWQAGLLAALVVVVTPPLVAVVAERSGLTARPSLDAALLLSQTSELSLVIGLAGVLQGDLEPAVFTVIVLVTVVTMLLTPLLASDPVARRLLRLHPSQWRRPRREPPGGHVLVLGAGDTFRALMDALATDDRRDVLVVDRDPAVTEALREAGVRALCGEITDPRMLEAAGAGRARAVVSTVARPGDVEEALRAAGQETRVLVRATTEQEARWVRSLGGEPVLFAEGAADDLMAWYDRVAGELAGRGGETG